MDFAKNFIHLSPYTASSRAFSEGNNLGSKGNESIENAKTYADNLPIQNFPVVGIFLISLI